MRQGRTDWTRWLVVGFLIVSIGGCASAPEPKPEDLTAPSRTKPAEVIAPLTEGDRKAGAAAEEKVAVAAAPQGTKTVEDQVEQPAPPPEPLGEEATRLLSTAARLANENPTEARKMFEQAAEDNPRCYQCYFNLGVLQEMEGKFSEAVSAYQKALSIHPTHLPGVVNLSNLYLRMGRIDLAQSLVSTAVKAGPRDLGLRNQLTAVLLAAKKMTEAAEQTKGVLLVDERNVQAMIHLAQVYYLQGKSELAERILLKAQQIDSSNSIVSNRLGFVYLQMDNLASAIAAFKKAVELDPNLSEAHNNLGVLYLRAHDYTAATEEFRKAIAQAPHFFEAFMNLGNSLRGDKQYKEAEEAFIKAAALNPKESRVDFNLGLLYLDDEVPGVEKTKRFSLALASLEKFQRSGGSHPKLVGYIEEAKKKQERAEKDEVRRKQQEEEKKRKEEESRLKAEAEAKTKAEAEAKAKAEAEAKAETEAKAKAKAEAEAKAREAARVKAEEAAKQKSTGIGGKLGGGKDDPIPGQSGKLGGGKDDEPEGNRKPPAGKVGGDEK